MLSYGSVWRKVPNTKSSLPIQRKTDPPTVYHPLTPYYTDHAHGRPQRRRRKKGKEKSNNSNSKLSVSCLPDSVATYLTGVFYLSIIRIWEGGGGAVPRPFVYFGQNLRSFQAWFNQNFRKSLKVTFQLMPTVVTMYPCLKQRCSHYIDKNSHYKKN